MISFPKLFYCQQISIISTLGYLMKQIKFIEVDYEHLSEIFFYMAHHRGQPILGIFATDRQKYFYNFAITNLKYTNIECETFAEIQQNPELVKGKICMIMDIPPTFQTMKSLLDLAQQSVEIAIVLMRKNKKYINMINKKLFEGKLNYIVASYSHNDLVGINRKLRDLVDQSYDLNRAAFYAYGAYLNNFRASLLKFIFKTEDIDVGALAKSFGFTTPPRVKEGNFLKVQVRKEKIKQKLKLKRHLKKQRAIKKASQIEQEQNETPQKMSSMQKIKALAAKKTKLIMKKRQKVEQTSSQKGKILKKSKNTTKQGK